MSNVVKFIIPLFALAFLLVSCSKTVPTTTPSSSTDMQQVQDQTAPPYPSAATRVLPQLQQAREKFDGTLLAGKHTVVLRTSKGDITVEVDADAAPKTATNFVWLSKSGYYSTLAFHRIIPGFMIQGGDPNGNGSGGESIFGATFEDEINASSYGLDKKTLEEQADGEPLPPQLAKLTIQQFYEQQGFRYNGALQSLPMKRGAIVMANRGPNTNGSQFFIVQAASVPWLEGRHTVFGHVVSGMEIVDAIAKVQRDKDDRPMEPVTFTAEAK